MTELPKSGPRESVFIFEKAVGDALSDMKRTRPITADLSLTLRMASFQQTREFLLRTGEKNTDLWDKVAVRGALSGIAREFLALKAAEQDHAHTPDVVLEE